MGSANATARSVSRPSHATRRTSGIVFMVMLSACAGASPRSGAVQPDDQVVLVVENQHWSEVVIHIVQGGTPRRLGSVSSMRTAELTIPEAYVIGATDITIALSPVGSNERYVLPSIMVSPGGRVWLQAARTLSQSTLSLRERFY